MSPSIIARARYHVATVLVSLFLFLFQLILSTLFDTFISSLFHGIVSALRALRILI